METEGTRSVVNNLENWHEKALLENGEGIEEMKRFYAMFVIAYVDAQKENIARKNVLSDYMTKLLETFMITQYVN